MSNELCFLPATVLADRIRIGELSPIEVVDAFLERIHDGNGELNAYVTVLDDQAREAAREAHRAVKSGRDLGPLHGVPVAIKDLFAFKSGVRHTFGSTVCSDFVPDRDAPVVERLERAGAIVLGKTNTPEFGSRPVTDNRLVGATGTPFDPSKTAGGTSGGSAAAVADGMAVMAQGSDAGGSIRIPAACCGVYGFKPSFGRVPNGSRPNAFAEHTPFVQNGPLTRTVADAALMLDVLAGPHPSDPFTHPDDVDYIASTRRSIDGMDIAYSPDLGLFTLENEIHETIDDAVGSFGDAGANVKRVEVSYRHSKDEIQDAWRTFFQVLISELALKMEVEYGIDLLGTHAESVDPLFVKIVEAGRRYSVMDLKRADIVRTDVYDAIQALFSEYDLLVTPTLAVPPFAKTSSGPREINGEKADPFIDWILTWPFNMTDHPAASIPAGFTRDGLPVGMQLIGPRLADDTVLAASAAFERARPWQASYPPS